MIALRRCRRCGKIFDATVETDLNLYCEDCREIQALIVDTAGPEPDIPEEFLQNDLEFTELLPENCSDTLLATVQANLEKYNKESAQSSTSKLVRVPKKNRDSTQKNKTTIATEPLDEETLSFLDSMDLSDF